jgi:hypothetical protein
MGFTRVPMGYNSFYNGYIIRVHSLPSKIEGFVEKVDEKKLLL